MKRTFALCFPLGLILLLAGCMPQVLPTPTPMPDLGLNLLVEVVGDLSHKRPGWAEHLPLSFGTVLDRDDLLRAAPDAHGILVCADWTLEEIPGDYLGGLPCSQSKVTLTRRNSPVIGPQRLASLASSTPHVLSPRHTFIQTTHPLLRWHPSSTGTVAYVVRVWGDTLEWQAETTATELRYPEDAPPLEEGIPYRLTVMDREGRSSDEEQTTLDLSFALLPSEEVTVVKSLVAQAHRLGLDERSASLLEAEIYAAYGLRADAIALLEELAGRENIPTVYQRLADLYLEVGLYTEAQNVYERALGGYGELGDSFGKANVLFGLGLAHWGNRDYASARGYLELAGEQYNLLGDAAGLDKVERELVKMGGDQ